MSSIFLCDTVLEDFRRTVDCVRVCNVNVCVRDNVHAVFLLPTLLILYSILLTPVCALVLANNLSCAQAVVGFCTRHKVICYRENRVGISAGL